MTTEQTVTVTGPNAPTHVHAAGCADLRKRIYANPDERWTITVTSELDLAEAIWCDIAGDTTAHGTPEHEALCLEYLASEYTVMPCVRGLA